MKFISFYDILFLFCFIFKSEECFRTTIGILCGNLCARKIFEKGEQKSI